jgi:hypothetical protein
MLDMTENYKEAMDIVKSWTAPNIDSVIELAENEEIAITQKTMDLICNDIKKKRQAKFDSVFGINATGIRLF